MNSLPRWLISITDTPLPCQSSISTAAWRSTGSGRTAGPGLKLNGRVMRPHYRAQVSCRAETTTRPEGASQSSRRRSVAAGRLLHQRCRRRRTARLGRGLGGLRLDDQLALFRADAVVDDTMPRLDVEQHR